MWDRGYKLVRALHNRMTRQYVPVFLLLSAYSLTLVMYLQGADWEQGQPSCLCLLWLATSAFRAQW